MLASPSQRHQLQHQYAMAQINHSAAMESGSAASYAIEAHDRDDTDTATATPTRDSGTRSNDNGVWMGAFERVMGDQADVFGGGKQTTTSSSSLQAPFKRAANVNRQQPDGGTQDMRLELDERGKVEGAMQRQSTLDVAQLQRTPQRPQHIDRPQSSPRPPADAASAKISITPSVMDFGLANVGTRKSANFTVRNLSETNVARVQLRFVSKVVSMNRDEIEISPAQSVELRVDFFPRRVNEHYRKQVTVANLLNRSNDQILEIRSTNVDGQRIGFHSLFYRILTPTGSNFIDFGDVNINCTRLRTFAIENVSNAPLSLELSAANTEDLKLYVKSEPSHSSAGASRRSSVTKYSIEDGTASTPSEPDPVIKLATSKAKRTAHLKERFLENMSYDVPASARNENKTWRIAQKQSHVVKPGSGHPKNGEKTHDRKEPAKKPHINLVAALKKGGKGRLTQRYGRSITFKDRTLISEFEYLDLASGPPVDGKRISAKSRKYQLLDANETGKSTGVSRKKIAEHHLHEASSPARRLPGSLVDDIHRVGSSQRSDSYDSRRPSPALTGKRKAGPMLHDAIDVSELSLDELVAAVEGQSSSLSAVFLSNARAEEQLVRTEVNLQREMRNAIHEGRLLPVDVLSLEPQEEKQVLAIYTPNGSTRPHIQGNARKQDSRIFIRLVDFGTHALGHVKDDFTELLKTDRDELPVRDLMVKSNLCRSLMELSQPHINFGHVQKGETKTRKIVIQNRGELALRYCIRKSGSIASGDIKLKSTDRYGIVPGHGKREVEFVFCPSLTGPFQERLTVENVADRDRDEAILIKANVTRVSNFSVEPRAITFARGDDGEEGALRIDELCSSIQSFVLTNVSAKSRSFVVRIDNDDLRHGAYHVEVILSTSTQDEGRKGSLTKAEEEEVEHISQKLKIANRKGQSDKIRKYQDRLTELGVPIPQQQVGSPPLNGEAPTETESNEGPKATVTSNGPTAAQKSEEVTDTIASVVRVSTSVTIALSAQQSKKFLVRLRPSKVAKPDAEHQYHHDAFDVRIPIQVHEVKNTDEVQIVELRAAVQAMPANAIPGLNHDQVEEDDSLAIRLPLKEEPLALFSSQRSASSAMTTATPSPTTEEPPSTPRMS